MSAGATSGTSIDNASDAFWGTSVRVDDDYKLIVDEDFEANLRGLLKDSELKQEIEWTISDSASFRGISISTGSIILGLFGILSILAGYLVLQSVFGERPIVPFKLSGFIFIGIFGLTLEVLYSKKLKQ
jgi:hypothetical protein